MKASMTSLEKKDPEFYKYLQENDADLLNFDVSDLSASETEADEMYHVPPASLEVRGILKTHNVSLNFIQ